MIMWPKHQMTKKEMDDFVLTNPSWQLLRKRKPLYSFRNHSNPKIRMYYMRSDKLKLFTYVERDIYRTILLEIFKNVKR